MLLFLIYNLFDEYDNSDYIVIAGMGTETILKILEN